MNSSASTKTIQITGPAFTNYSLAKVNRGLALALAKIQNEYSVNVYLEREKVDKYPAQDDLNKFSKLKKLFREEPGENDVVIYNNYPKAIGEAHGLKELHGKIKIMYVAWEESIYPEAWVSEINENLHGVMAASTFVREILQNSGVKVPIVVIPNAMDDKQLGAPSGTYPLQTEKKFKFLHVSSALKRKGIDVLIKAYYQEFTKDDDVTLIIKSFPSPSNIVQEVLDANAHENAPEVIHIMNPDLSEKDIQNLVFQSDCAVYPSRAEGFGLPILEAMYNRVPVIATNYSGYLDFCDEECAYMIDYKIDYAKDSDLINLGAKWAEPDVDQLAQTMREVFATKQGSISDSDGIKGLDSSALKLKLDLAEERARKINWENSAKQTLGFIKQLEKVAGAKDQNVAVLTFLNDKTGIAEYSLKIFNKIEGAFNSFFYISNKDIADRIALDAKNVVRNWTTGETTFEDVIAFMQSEKITVLNIQYHSGSMFAPESLDVLLKTAVELGVKVVLTFHAVRGDSFDFIKTCKNLKLADKIIIHNRKDSEYAAQTLGNVTLMTLPTLNFKKRNKALLKKKLGIETMSPVLVSHGLLNKNKGIANILEAVNFLKRDYPNILFLALNAVSPNNIYAQGIFEELQSKINEYGLEENVLLFPDFLSDELIEVLMQIGDINILAYDDVGESGSAAVRKALATYNPTIVTDITMFDEFTNEVLKVRDNGPLVLLDGIVKLIEDPELAHKITRAARKYSDENEYNSKALRMLDLIAN